MLPPVGLHGLMPIPIHHWRCCQDRQLYFSTAACPASVQLHSTCTCIQLCCGSRIHLLRYPHSCSIAAATVCLFPHPAIPWHLPHILLLLLHLLQHSHATLRPRTPASREPEASTQCTPGQKGSTTGVPLCRQPSAGVGGVPPADVAARAGQHQGPALPGAHIPQPAPRGRLAGGVHPAGVPPLLQLPL